MTSAIARWHSSARPPSDALELAYADRLEAEMQELAIQLHKVNGESREGMCRNGERGFWRQTCRGHSRQYNSEGRKHYSSYPEGETHWQAHKVR